MNYIIILALIVFTHMHGTKNQTANLLQDFLRDIIKSKETQQITSKRRLATLKTTGASKSKIKSAQRALAKRESSLEHYKQELALLSDGQTASSNTVQYQEPKSLCTRCTTLCSQRNFAWQHVLNKQSYFILVLGSIYAGLGFAIGTDFFSYLTSREYI